jgi:hypothetical protein
MGRTAQAPMDLREGEEAKSLIKNDNGYLKDLSGNHNVRIFWDMNPESTADQVFILKIDDTEVYLLKQELLRYLRNI